MNTSPEPVQRNGRSDIVAATVAPPLPYHQDPGNSIPAVQHADHPTLLNHPAEKNTSPEETLGDLAAQIQQVHVSVARASVAIIKFAVTAGQLLLKAKTRVEAGSWEAWVESNCKFSARTARDYMRIARAFDEGLLDTERQHAAGLDSLRQVLAVLREEDSKTADDGSAAAFIAWNKARQRFITLTEQLDDVRFPDAASRALFRDLVREAVAFLWKYAEYPQGRLVR